jgi:uncharacterized protein
MKCSLLQPLAPRAPVDQDGWQEATVARSLSRTTRMNDIFCVFNQTRESFLSLSVTRADTHVARLKGLLGKITLKSDEGLWTVPSQGIHTLFMLFPIDLLYLDANNRVVHLIENVGTFRLTPIRRESESVLQLKTRTIFSSNTQIGDQLVICAPSDIEQYCKRQDARDRPRV